ncbi:uncharacterized protein V6R79_026182 [Siganus canaliculatus]
MLWIVSSGLTALGWLYWMFLQTTFSGASSVTVHQPSVLTAALGHDVTMPCQIIHSAGEKITGKEVLYWEYSTKGSESAKNLLHLDDYKDRVDILDKNPVSLNKSILLRNVQWADSGTYLCKLSIREPQRHFRKKGRKTLLLVYDTMTFNLTSHSDSLLLCEVKVTRDSRFVLSIFYNGARIQTVNHTTKDGVAAAPHVTLSHTACLSSEGRYQCLLHFSETLITESVFHFLPTGQIGNSTNRNVSTSTERCVALYPEPWPLYVALLLVPVVTLLSFITALLLCRAFWLLCHRDKSS